MWGSEASQINGAERTQTSTPKSHSVFFAEYILYSNVAIIKKQIPSSNRILENSCNQIHLCLSEYYKGHVVLVGVFFGGGRPESV